MKGMRALLRGSLGKSLSTMAEVDRLAAAWTVVCGPALSGRGSIAGYATGVLEIQVVDAVWMQQMSAMRTQLTRELGSVADVPVREIHFVVRDGSSAGSERSEAGGPR